MTEIRALHSTRSKCTTLDKENRDGCLALPLPQERKAQPWAQAWLPFSLFQTRSGQPDCLDIVQEEPDDGLDAEQVDSDHFEDAYTAPLSPAAVCKDRPTVVKCASKPLLASKGTHRHKLKRAPTKTDLSCMQATTKPGVPHGGIGAGDHSSAHGDPHRDSDDEVFGDLARLHPLGRSSSCSSNFTVCSGGALAKTSRKTSVSDGDLRPHNVDMKAPCRSPPTKYHGYPQLSAAADEPKDALPTSGENDPPTAVLVDLDEEPVPRPQAPEPITVRRVRSALLRLKDSIVNGILPEEDDDSRTYSRPDSAGSYSGAELYTKSGAYWKWMRRKQREDDMRREAERRMEEQKAEEEEREREEKERKRLEEEESFRSWLEKKDLERNEKRRLAEEQERIQKEKQEAKAQREAELSKKCTSLWIREKNKAIKERLAAQAREAARIMEEKMRRKEESEKRFEEWREKHRNSTQGFSQYVNPVPWVDILPPPAEEPPAPRKKRGSRRRSIRSQQRAAERLSRPIVHTSSRPSTSAAAERPHSSTVSRGPAWSFARPKTATSSAPASERRRKIGDASCSSVTSYLQLAGATTSGR